MFDELSEAWKREFHSSELQRLRPGFFKDLSSYVRRLREAQHNLDAKSLKSFVIKDEIVRIELLVTQLLDRRLSKISSLPDSVESSDLESVEKEASQTLSGLARDYDMIKEDLVQGREASTRRSKDGEFVLVRFEKDVPSIMGIDLKTRGPFRREDVAKLRRENAESLIRQGAATEITVAN